MSATSLSANSWRAAEQGAKRQAAGEAPDCRNGPGAGNYEPGAGNYEPGADNYEPGAGNYGPGVYNYVALNA